MKLPHEVTFASDLDRVRAIRQHVPIQESMEDKR
jgi:alpha-D-ribose 1-methylphosphonate 5-triphosphate synthase subunit PhnI